MSTLSISDLDAGYDDFQALFGVDLDLDDGETLAVVGANGAGKTTLLLTIAGVLRPWRGVISMDGTDITHYQDFRRARTGIALVPEGRRLFTSLTVEENLRVSASARGTGPWTLDAIYELFPLVAAARRRRAGVLSGGEQQAVAIARALVGNPRILLLDEVSLGLAPSVVDSLYRLLPEMRASGVSIMLVDQDIDRAMSVSSRVVCLLEGRVALVGDTAMLHRDQLISSYFGAPGGSVPDAGGPR